MTAVNRSALVRYSALQMFALVADIESYPRFLPWCERAAVSVREPGRTVATPHINFHGLRRQFTTANTSEPGVRIGMKLVAGPFRSLDGNWRFTALDADACKVEFDLQYRFSSHLLEKAAGPVFHRIANSLVEAFVRRARETYAA